MQHAVAVERVIQPVERRMDRVLGVAEVDALEIGRDLAVYVEVVGVVLDELRLPRAGAVGMIVVGRQRGRDPVRDLDPHRLAPYA